MGKKNFLKKIGIRKYSVLFYKKKNAGYSSKKPVFNFNGKQVLRYNDKIYTLTKDIQETTHEYIRYKKHLSHSMCVFLIFKS